MPLILLSIGFCWLNVLVVVIEGETTESEPWHF